MLRRLLGLLMLIAALAPLLLGVVGAFGIRSLADAVTTAADTRIEAMNTQLDQIDIRIAVARDGLAEVAQIVDVVTENLTTINTSINAISTVLQIPNLDLPDIRADVPVVGRVAIPLPEISFPAIELPMLADIRTFLQGTADIMRDLVRAVGVVADLRYIADDMQGAYTELTSFGQDIEEILAANSVLLIFLAAGGTIWLIILYIAFLGDWLIRGSRYLRGLE